MLSPWPLFFLAFVHARVVFCDVDVDGLNDALEERLAAKFAPIVHFHPDEIYYPTSVESFLSASSLYYRRGDAGPDCLFRTFNTGSLPSLTGYRRDIAARATTPVQSCTVNAALPPGTHEFTRRGLRGGSGSGVGSAENGPLSACASLLCATYETVGGEQRFIECMDRFEPSVSSIDMDSLETRSFFLEADDDYISTAKHRSPPEDLDATAPLYVHIFPTINHAFPGTITVQYWMFYPFNGPTHDILRAGAHEGDWEHVSIIIDPSSETILAVYFAAHSHEAFWLDPWQLHVEDGSHVHVYVALHTHASYESAGDKRRRLELLPRVHLTDYCRDDGLTWTPSLLVNLGEDGHPYPTTHWTHFNGHWGSRRREYSPVPLLLDTGFPPRGPTHQTDYWFLN